MTVWTSIAKQAVISHDKLSPADLSGQLRFLNYCRPTICATWNKLIIGLFYW